MKSYTFKQLSKSAKMYCLTMQKKYNFKKLTNKEIIEKIGGWQFKKDGSFFTGLN